MIKENYDIDNCPTDAVAIVYAKVFRLEFFFHWLLQFIIRWQKPPPPPLLARYCLSENIRKIKKTSLSSLLDFANLNYLMDYAGKYWEWK